jgi:hypothetical protein
MSEPDIYYLVQLRASAIEQSKKDGYTWMSPEHVIRLLDAFEEKRAQNAELVAELKRLQALADERSLVQSIRIEGLSGPKQGSGNG